MLISLQDAHVVKIQLGYRVAHLTPVSDSKCRFPFSFRNGTYFGIVSVMNSICPSFTNFHLVPLNISVWTIHIFFKSYTETIPTWLDDLYSVSKPVILAIFSSIPDVESSFYWNQDPVCFLTLHGACFCFRNLLPWSLALLLVVMVINFYFLAISSGGTLASQWSGEIPATGHISCSTPQMLKVLTEQRRVLSS